MSIIDTVQIQAAVGWGLWMDDAPFPGVGDVRDGTFYGPQNEFEGTLNVTGGLDITLEDDLVDLE